MNCNLTEIPKEVFMLKSLRRLQISYNEKLTDLKNIEQLSQLEFLAVFCCNLKSLPSELTLLNSLKELYIGENNKIKKSKILDDLIDVSVHL